MSAIRNLTTLALLTLAGFLASCGSGGGGGGIPSTGNPDTTNTTYRILEIEAGRIENVEAPTGGIDAPQYRDTHLLFARQQNGNYVGVHQVTKAQWKRLSQGETPWDQVETLPADIMTSALPGDHTEAYNLSPTEDAPGITSVVRVVARYGSAKSINLRPATAKDLVGAEKIVERGLVRSVAAPDQAAGATLLDERGESAVRTVEDEAFALNGVRLALVETRSSALTARSTTAENAIEITIINHANANKKYHHLFGDGVYYIEYLGQSKWTCLREQSTVDMSVQINKKPTIVVIPRAAEYGLRVNNNKITGKLTGFGYIDGTATCDKIPVKIRIKVHPPIIEIGKPYSATPVSFEAKVAAQEIASHRLSINQLSLSRKESNGVESVQISGTVSKLPEGKVMDEFQTTRDGGDFRVVFANYLRVDPDGHWHSQAKIPNPGEIRLPIDALNYNINESQVNPVSFFIWGGDSPPKPSTTRDMATHEYKEDLTGGKVIGRTNDRYAMDVNVNFETKPGNERRTASSDYLPGFNSDKGLPVYAIADGECAPYSGATFKGGGGSSGYILLKHTTNEGLVWYSVYMHMSDITERTLGQRVPQGARLGYISDTGLPQQGVQADHLHFACYVPRLLKGHEEEGEYLISVDPRTAFTTGTATGAHPFQTVNPRVDLSATIGGLAPLELTRSAGADNSYTAILNETYNSRGTTISVSATQASVWSNGDNGTSQSRNVFLNYSKGIKYLASRDAIKGYVNQENDTYTIELLKKLTVETPVIVYIGTESCKYLQITINLKPSTKASQIKLPNASKNIPYPNVDLRSATQSNVSPVQQRAVKTGVALTPHASADSNSPSSTDHWSAIPAVPFGLTLNPTTGFISGIPSGALSSGPELFAVYRRTADGQSYQTSASIQLVPAVINVTMVKGVPGSWTNPYAVNFPSGSQWTVKEGRLPPGVQMDPANGNLSGTPAEGAQSRIRWCIITCNGADVQFKIKVLDAAFDPAGSQWSVAPVENGVTGPYDPIPWSFEADGTLHAGSLWNGTWAALVGNTSRCVNVTQGPYAFDVTFSADGANFLAYRDGVVFRTANRAWAVPVITSASTATIMVGERFTYATTATNTPSSFAATGLPSPLIINPLTGVISGTPTQTGTFTVSLSAKNAIGSGTLNVVFTVTVDTGNIVIGSTANGTSILSLKKIVNDFLTDPDGTKFYRSQILLSGPNKTTVTVSDGLYTTGRSDGFGSPAMLVWGSGHIDVFVSHKVSGGSYAMSGYIFGVDGTVVTSRTSVFNNANTGWFPAFPSAQSLNSISIEYFTFSGYQWQSSSLTTDGTWTTTSLESIDPSVAQGRYRPVTELFSNPGTPIAPVPKTGQTTSYAAGDDGALQPGVALPVPRFTDNANGTVTDNATGLVWLKNASAFNNKNWSQALDACASLASGQAGLTDGSTAGQWRLPNREELLSLVEYGRTVTVVPSGNTFSSVVNTAPYWSSTTYVGNTRYAWRMDFLYGGANSADKANACFVWPVRAGP